jgi:hypothetical protein
MSQPSVPSVRSCCAAGGHTAQMRLYHRYALTVSNVKLLHGVRSRGADLIFFNNLCNQIIGNGPSQSSDSGQ